MPTHNDPLGRVWAKTIKESLVAMMGVRSGHVDEAFAMGWGFRNHAAFLASHNDAPPQPPAEFKVDAFLGRLAELSGKPTHYTMPNEIGIMFGNQGYRVTRADGADFVPELDWFDMFQAEVEAATGLINPLVDAAMTLAWGFKAGEHKPAEESVWPPMTNRRFDAKAMEAAVLKLGGRYPAGLTDRIASSLSVRGYRVTSGSRTIANGVTLAPAAPWIETMVAEVARLCETSKERIECALSIGWGYRYAIEWHAGFVDGQPAADKAFSAARGLEMIMGLAGGKPDRLAPASRLMLEAIDEAGYRIVDQHGETVDVEHMWDDDEDGDGVGTRPAPPKPMPFVPRDAKRPRLVSQALNSHFKSGMDDAKHVTALLYGHRSWDALQKAIAKGPADKPDEAAGAIATRERAQFQQAVLVSHSSMGPMAARRAVERLHLTEASGKPSLAGFAEEERNMLFQDMPGMDDPFGADAMKSFAEMAGIELPPGMNGADLMEGMRTMRKTHPKAWLGILRTTAGIEVIAPQPNADTHGSLLGQVTNPANGEALPIYLSSIAYQPGDHADVTAEQTRMAILDQGIDQAIVIYDSPMMIETRGKSPKALIYLGEILTGGRWHDVCLPTRGQGMAGVLAQIGRPANDPDDAFIAEFGDEPKKLREIATAIK